MSSTSTVTTTSTTSYSSMPAIASETPKVAEYFYDAYDDFYYDALPPQDQNPRVVAGEVVTLSEKKRDPYIKICFLRRAPIELSYKPEEPIWHFNRRAGEQLPDSLEDNNESFMYELLLNNQAFNSYVNRLMPMKTFINEDTEKVHAISWRLHLNDGYYFRFNATERGFERETCAICKDLMIYQKKDESLFSCVLKCGHAFHNQCLGEAIKNYQLRSCPICRDDLSDTFLSYI